MLFGHEICFVCEKHARTSHTDRQATYCSMTALCIASRGKNHPTEKTT